ncbi:hypothetical protein BMJ34_24280 [Sinorhizobium medicae]|uniref:Uncharacterized protein n=1 Tax=Sinorhizobium medicae TaxID=110321 RepID=A0ABX4TJA1_9HYPH|nr:hypothetical protein BMJ35_21370 [Sinorhizobium medicae]PLT92672.1 hypothetical protein BMJ34_24280 [Sinorhizobium medicae]PLU00980.1 hypothetical protein BMJ33_19980 [Sinorhizobium medicae]PLU21147.1 hypothetical protein BMJ30_06565 [Sinorhizobium medicae]PLU21471.1 hypothetical protein BMJ29_10855 [Sinorhizobium medicae]
MKQRRSAQRLAVDAIQRTQSIAHSIRRTETFENDANEFTCLPVTKTMLSRLLLRMDTAIGFSRLL